MRRLAVVVGVGGLVLAAACASLTGLSGGDGTPAAPPPEAGAEAAPLEAAAPPTDPCSHAAYPPPPAKDDDPTGQVPTLVFAVRHESVSGAVDGGAPIGFDLDGVCSCFSDTTTAHGGASSCIPPEGGAPACDGDGGVDRQISALLAAYTVPSLSGTYGGPTLLFKVTKYNGRANDSEVFVGIIASPGIFDRTGCPGADEAGAGPYAPTWKGCDLFALDESSVLPSTNEPLLYLQGYVTNHVLVVPPSVKPVLFIVGNTSLLVSASILSARLVALDTQLEPIDPPPDVGTLFRLEGTTAGRVNTTDGLRAIAKGQAMTDGGPLCGFPNFYNSVKRTFICPSADIATSPADDFKSKDCDALSLAAAFVADPAMLGVARKPDPSPCGDPADPKYASFFDCAK